MLSGKFELPFCFLDLSFAMGLPVTVVPSYTFWKADSLQVWQTGIPFSFLNLEILSYFPFPAFAPCLTAVEQTGSVDGFQNLPVKQVWVTSEGQEAQPGAFSLGLFHTSFQAWRCQFHVYCKCGVAAASRLLWLPPLPWLFRPWSRAGPVMLHLECVCLSPHLHFPPKL